MTQQQLAITLDQNEHYR